MVRASGLRGSPSHLSALADVGRQTGPVWLARPAARVAALGPQAAELVRQIPEIKNRPAGEQMEKSRTGPLARGALAASFGAHGSCAGIRFPAGSRPTVCALGSSQRRLLWFARRLLDRELARSGHQKPRRLSTRADNLSVLSAAKLNQPTRGPRTTSGSLISCARRNSATGARFGRPWAPPDRSGRAPRGRPSNKLASLGNWSRRPSGVRVLFGGQ